MPPPRRFDQVRDRLRVKHYSMRTEDAYLHWMRRFIFFHDKKHPREMGGPLVEAFLSHFATDARVAASTQNQALSALLFLYREVLQVDLPWLDGLVRAKQPKRVPLVLTENEVRALLAQLEGTRWLVVSLLYSSGMRLLEGLRLRVKDIDFERREITVRDGRGARSRDHAVGNFDRAAEHASGACAGSARARSCGGLWRSAYAVRAGAQIPEGRAQLDLAVCFSLGQPFGRPCRRRDSAASSG
jgi:integrase